MSALVKIPPRCARALAPASVVPPQPPPPLAGPWSYRASSPPRVEEAPPSSVPANNYGSGQVRHEFFLGLGCDRLVKPKIFGKFWCIPFRDLGLIRP
jgi:hypothetical protein